MWQQENDFLAVTVNADASALIVDKVNGASWEMGRIALQEEGEIEIGHVWLRTGRSICEQYPGRFRGEAQPDGSIRYTLIGREGREVGQFMVQYALEGASLVVRIADIDESIPSLVFPPPLVNDSLVLPHGVGLWVRQPIPERRFWVYPVHLNMRWIGGLKANSGWMGIIEEGYADGGVMLAALHASPGWLKSLGTWGTSPRSLRYQFIQGGYVELAKAYRAYVIEKGFHKSLREKIAERPEVKNLLGGRLISFYQGDSRRCFPERFESVLAPVPPQPDSQPEVYISHRDALRLLEELKTLGIERGILNVRGWLKGGYDETHPDVFPPDPAFGTTDELKALLAQDDPFIAALHDNYQDIYPQSPSYPKGIVWGKNGDTLRGGFWAGGQAYILNSRDGLAYARRNWQDLQSLNPRAMFIDTTICVQFYQSYESGNTLTRAQDEQYKIDLLRFFRERVDVVGSEEGSEFGIPYVDWIENRHRRVAGQSIPLWNLVFHDAAYCSRYVGMADPSPDGNAFRAEWLNDMLWGYMLISGFREPDQWEAVREFTRQTLHVDQWHGRVGLDEMLSHRYLTEDGEVEETVFSSGVSIIVNFAGESRTVEGVEVPAQGYVIRE